MDWKQLKSEEDLNNAVEESKANPIVIFKYSSRCSISDRVFSIFELDWASLYSVKESDVKIIPYFLDLIQFRNLSNEIARRFNVVHESPQVLVIKNGECIFHESHGMVRVDDVLKSIA